MTSRTLARCVLPIALLTPTCLTTALCGVLRHLSLGLSSSARKFDETVRAFLAKTAHRLRLDDVSALASSILLLSTSALVWAWWHFYPLLNATTTSISTGPADLLATFSPGLQDYQEHYRLVFCALVISTIAAWYVAFKLAARRGQTINLGLVAGGVATVILTFVFLTMPYRLTHDDNKFKAVIWKGADCYLLGERADEMLLFCPKLQPPRTRVLQKSAETLERLDRSESIFTSFSSMVNASK